MFGYRAAAAVRRFAARADGAGRDAAAFSAASDAASTALITASFERYIATSGLARADAERRAGRHGGDDVRRRERQHAARGWLRAPLGAPAFLALSASSSGAQRVLLRAAIRSADRGDCVPNVGRASAARTAASASARWKSLFFSAWRAALSVDS